MDLKSGNRAGAKKSGSVMELCILIKEYAFYEETAFQGPASHPVLFTQRRATAPAPPAPLPGMRLSAREKAGTPIRRTNQTKTTQWHHSS